MTATSSGSSSLTALPAPQGLPSTVVSAAPGGSPLTPKQQIHFYSPDEWEEFILEYATGLSENYFQVMRIGGSNDRGADVAAFLTPKGFEGEWDCFQCKHYDAALLPSHAYPEIFKIIKAVVENHYSMPRRYLFMAPQGCGPGLKRLIQSPSKFRSDFLGKFSGDKPLGAGLDSALVAKIEAEATILDFSMFKSVEMHEILDVHYKTRYYATRFTARLPMRPDAPPPPDTPSDEERRYIEQLFAVYREKHGIEVTSHQDILHDPKMTKHFSRQREAFYSAESLRLFARDSVPKGTFEKLQVEVYDGVIETHERDFPDGMERLTSVLEKAADLPVAGDLITVSKQRDKRGICHQLANVDRLIWCDET